MDVEGNDTNYFPIFVFFCTFLNCFGVYSYYIYNLKFQKKEQQKSDGQKVGLENEDQLKIYN